MHRYAIFAVAFCAFAQEKWVDLFAHGLDGWERRNGTAKYELAGGVVTGTTAEGSPNSFLCTRRDYGDFILEFEVKTDLGLNSGVQIRSHQYARETEVVTENNGKRKRTHPAGRVYGYQVEVADAASAKSGGIFDESRRGWIATATASPFRDNEWNRYRVEARGDRIRVWVNGVETADLVDSADLTGFIGLQVHAYRGPAPKQVRWRNVRIQDLGKHEWTRATDGKTLAGWRKWGGGEWTVEDGALHGTHPAGGERGFLVSEKAYGDHTFRLRYKAVKGNSGVFFRMLDPENFGKGAIGYEVEVDPSRDPGGLQEVRGRGWIQHIDAQRMAEVYRAGDWNELTVSAHGGRVVTHINGNRMVEVKDDPGPKQGKMALQLNPQEIDVWYRDIEILTPAR